MLRLSIPCVLLAACASSPPPPTSSSSSASAAPSPAAPQPPTATAEHGQLGFQASDLPDGPCGGFEKRPLTSPAALLANRLTIRPFEGLVDLGRPFDVMSAPHPDEAETRLYVDEGGRQVAVFVEELFRRADASTDDTIRKVDSAAKDARMFRTTIHGLTSIVVLPHALEPDHEKALALRLYVQTTDTTMIRLSFYVSPAVLPSSTGCARLAARMAETLEAGSRRLELDGGDRDLEGGLRITVAKNVALIPQPGPDFIVYRGYEIGDFSGTAAKLSLYVGDHPESLESGPMVSAPLLGRTVSWLDRRTGTAHSREAQLRLPKSRDTVHVHFGGPNETSFQKLAKMVETLRVR